LLVGGDWMPLWRFLIPGLPLAILLGARAFDACTMHWSRGAKCALLFASALMHGFLNVQAALSVQRPAFSFPSGNAIRLAVSNGNPAYFETVRWLETLSPPPRSLAVGELGYFCHGFRAECMDLHGLIDKRISKSREFPNTVIGKKLPLGDADFSKAELGRYLLNRAPDLFILSLEETGGEREALFQGAYTRLKAIGNFRIFGPSASPRAVSPDSG